MQENNKPFGPWILTALVAGNMIGSGIFLLPKTLAQYGKAGLLGWLVTVIGIFILAIILSKMSQLVTKNGGPFAYAKQNLGNFVGFQTAYNHWIAMWVGIITMVIEMSLFLAILWPSLIESSNKIIIAIGIVWVLTIINMIGVRAAGAVQIITLVLKLIPILLFVLLGIAFFHPSLFWETTQAASKIIGHSSYSTINETAALTLWAFIGVESATIPYNLVKNPKRDIPLATFLGVIIAAIVYISSSSIIMGILPSDQIINSAFPFATAATLIFGPYGTLLMVGGAVISCIGSINGWLLIQGQLAKAAAEEKLFSEVFARSNRGNAPVAGLFITAVIISTLLLLTEYQNLTPHLKTILALAPMTMLIPYIFASISAMRAAQEPSYAIIKRKTFLVIAFLGTAYTLWAIIMTGKEVVYFGTLILLVSGILYGFGYGKTNKVES